MMHLLLGACLLGAPVQTAPALITLVHRAPLVTTTPEGLAAQSTAEQLFSTRTAEHVQQAVALWRARLDADPGDGDAAWKLSRALYWLGVNGPESADARRARLDGSIAAARRAMAIAPGRPEGHFWLAASMGMLAERYGRKEGLRYRNDIKAALERVIAIEPTFMRGAAERALGRWYASLPAMFGGNKKEAEVHLRRALDLAPDSTITLVLLADLLADTGRANEARKLLERAVAAPADPEWAPEDQVFRERARAVLTQAAR